ncbi:LacI family transcriptional regulator [Streptomyces sp. NBC_00184]|uniref:LacI family DNA-binding transcriptional regulator n=1 Tax=Streptomyces sp. NBC_00184 TaxID=2975673 RepID=UPI002E2B1006|nr:LacI family DNA-binding transcriptional regulator [Streptomyces sp. NBC_00184]
MNVVHQRGETVAKQRITIEDVAQAAGVSRQTVTRAMNDMAEIRSETRQRVLEAAEALGYRPSRFASNLASRQRSHAIGLVIASFRNPYYTELAAEVLDVATARGWQVVVCSREQGTDLELISTLAGQVDAIFGYFVAPDQASLAAAARGVPVVMFERTAAVPGLHSVDLDFEQGLEELLTELRNRGASRFGLIESDAATGPSPYEPTQRRRAYEKLAGPEPLPSIVVAEESMRGGADGFKRLWNSSPGLDAVLVFNDLMAMGAVHSAHTLGVSIPADVRIVGIDGLSLGSVTTPSLSTLSIDRLAVAKAAADIVDTLLKAHDAGPHESIVRTVTPRPLWRESA